MEGNILPVDVIGYFGADGDLRPLRIRIPEQETVGQICEVLQSGENRTLGAESRTFLCRIRYEAGHDTVLSELKYSVRGHCWYLSRPRGSFSRCSSGFRDV